MNIILNKDSNNINTMIDKIDFLANKFNISNNTSNNKNIYTIDDLLNIFNRLEQKNSPNKANNNLSNMEKFILILENEICIKKNIYVDHILNEIIKCIQTESQEVKKICSNQIKFILKNYNNLNSNIKIKLNMLNDLMINSK
jgi:hypothetical protein